MVILTPALFSFLVFFSFSLIFFKGHLFFIFFRSFTKRYLTYLLLLFSTHPFSSRLAALARLATNRQPTHANLANSQMTLLDALFSAGGGGVFGSLLHLGTSFFETYKKRKEAEIEVMVMKAKVDAAERTSAWQAFVASQQQRDSLSELPNNVHPIISNIYALVAAFRSFTRPGLTWALLAVLVYTYTQVNSFERAELTKEVVFGSFTALFWWFGSRYSGRKQ